MVKRPGNGVMNENTIAIRRLDASVPGFADDLRQLLAFEAGEDEAIDRTVAQILGDVKARGDAAVLEYTHRFDRVHADSVAALELAPAQLDAALDELEPKRRAALEAAAARVRSEERRVGKAWKARGG